MTKSAITWRGVRSPSVLEALRNTPRHEFVPAELAAHSYEDRALPIGYDQTISQPYIVGLMTDLLKPASHHKVLEIGTGSGYQAAVLSQLVDHLYSMEVVPELARPAQAALARLGYRNVSVRQGDGYAGWPEQAPFDRILLTAAPPAIPAALLEQLKPGGRLVAPVGVDHQELIIIDKDSEGALNQTRSIAVVFVPMVHGTKR